MTRPTREHVNKASDLLEHRCFVFKGHWVLIGDDFRISLKIKETEFATFQSQDRLAARTTFTALRAMIEPEMECAPATEEASGRRTGETSCKMRYEFC